MQPGSQQKFLRDYGLGFTVIITLIAAVFLGVALITPEIERRTILTILSKPVTRIEFLVGKYLGLMLTLVFNLVVMGSIFLLSYALFVVQKDGVDALNGGQFVREHRALATGFCPGQSRRWHRCESQRHWLGHGEFGARAAFALGHAEHYGGVRHYAQPILNWALRRLSFRLSSIFWGNRRLTGHA